MAIRVTVWNEYRHEVTNPGVAELYPAGIHGTVKEILGDEEFEVTTAILDSPDCGLPDELLESTDVLVWWGHTAHNEGPDDLVEKIRQRVYAGMGFVALHSAHHSKVFKAVVGTTGNLTWGDNQRGIVWNVCPTHPIAAGIPSNFEIFEELYSEPFFIPKPDDLIFATWFEQGNIFRGGATFTRGVGKVFYFHPGHETCKSFYNPYVRTIIRNGVRWCAPVKLEEGFKLDGCIRQRGPVIS